MSYPLFSMGQFSPALGIIPPIVSSRGLGTASAPAGSGALSVLSEASGLIGPVISIVEDVVSIFTKDNYQSQVFPICQRMARQFGVPVVAEWFGVFKGSDENGNAIQLGTSAQVANIQQDAITNAEFMQAAANSSGRSLVLIGNEQGTIYQKFDPQTTLPGSSAGTSTYLPMLLLGIGAFLLLK
jgi:hypothetical protein